MAREKKSNKKDEILNSELAQGYVPEQTVVVAEEKSALEREREQAAATAHLNIEKSTKDILLKTIGELQQHEKEVRAAIRAAGVELEGKYKALDHVSSEIKAQQHTLNLQKQKFDRDNEAAIKELLTKTAQLDEASETYKKLLVEVNEKRQLLNSEIAKIVDERKTHEREMNRLNRHVQEVKDDIKRREYDMSEQAEKLRLEREAFTAEMEAAKPELARLSELKAENKALWDKLEGDRIDFENRQQAFEHYKAQKDQEVQAAREKVKEQENVLRNLEAKYRKWEQDLNDADLELKAREAKVQQDIKRHKLMATVKGAESSDKDE